MSVSEKAEGYKSPEGKEWWYINGQVLYATNAEGQPVCLAIGCFDTEVTPTLIGLNFCADHFGWFFDAEKEDETWYGAPHGYALSYFGGKCPVAESLAAIAEAEGEKG